MPLPAPFALPTFPAPIYLDDLLLPFQHFGVNLGLSRIQTLLAALGNPQNRVPLLHVAGTNGKGSVCAYLTAILTAAGYRVGCHTSPHLVSWCERITVNQVPIAGADLRRVLQRTIAAIDPNQPLPTLFEVMSAATWLYFAECEVDVAVMEVGLGGRLDATNVCDRPLATVITSISRDHWQVLGETLGEIAGEKAGIFKAGCPAFSGQLPPAAAAVVADRARAVPCPLTWVAPAVPVPPVDRPDADTFGSDTSSPDRPQTLSFPPLQTLTSHGITYRIALQGAPQQQNSALALAVIQNLRQRGWQIDDAALQRGFATAQWPARLQWVPWGDRPLLLDGAHNPGSAVALRAYVDEIRQQWGETSGESGPERAGTTWMMGMLSTKEHDEIFRALLRSGDRLHLAPVPSHSTADPAQLATLARSLCPDLAHCHAHPSIAAALAAAYSEPPGTPTVLCGSLYLLGHVLEHQLLLPG
ncbi:MAG: bifunctional folylpolyglutamate synthase/dihydrofolate synthase [Prochlorothrix sp.]